MMTFESVLPNQNVYLIDKGCVLITEAANLLACNDVTTCKAMLIYHHYQNMAKEYYSCFQLIATASLQLSVELCEEEITKDEVLSKFKFMGMPCNKKMTNEEFEELLWTLRCNMIPWVFDRPYRDAATEPIEDELLCETAHKYVFSYLKAVSSVPDIQKNLISVQTWTLRLLSTFYHSQRCTLYSALEIALAALSLSFQQYKIDTKQTKTIIKDIFATVPEKKVRDVMDDILMVADIGTGNADYS